MARTYKWGLTSLRKADTDELTGVIVQTHWTCTGVDDDGVEGTFNGATPFKAEDVDPDNFTAYEDLTEEQVLGWIKDIVVGDYKDHVEAQIDRQIRLRRVRVEDIPADQFPWSQTEGAAA